MAMNYEELDQTTREYMLAEFEAEEASGNPYRGKVLSAKGLGVFPNLMRRAIKRGNEETLSDALNDPAHFKAKDARSRTVNVPEAAHKLALTEFSTWYVRGLAKRLLDEGVEDCQVYRGAEAEEPASCSKYEGAVVSVQEVYDGHRARYWPEPGNRSAFSVPFGPNCHHVIRRVP